MCNMLLESDFVVTSVAEELGYERLYRAAGFPPVRRGVVMRRFYTLVSFLHYNGLATAAVADSPSRVHEFSQLCRRDLTDEGLAFLRACYPKWVNRMSRDMGDARERVVLEGWLRKFREWAPRRAA